MSLVVLYGIVLIGVLLTILYIHAYQRREWAMALRWILALIVVPALPYLCIFMPILAAAEGQGHVGIFEAAIGSVAAVAHPVTLVSFFPLYFYLERERLRAALPYGAFGAAVGLLSFLLHPHPLIVVPGVVFGALIYLGIWCALWLFRDRSFLTNKEQARTPLSQRSP